MRAATEHAASVCPVEVTVSIVGGSWKLTIVQKLLAGTRRFGELRRDVGGVTDRVLTRQLRELESDGLVHREVFAQVPPRVEYSLTAEGESLRPLVEMMDEWGRQWTSEHVGGVPA
ncbi:winged helix-turn-helix transcriptional regulator [Microbacterium murale]|uniref:DNA-binding HxlR family transcriptional regulator n=1 Tax=Microbacterium murale TaxID=1081040 RepID=A0ABU0PCP3_9MICO|nr:helix-turn-helix domain-containing protein [Microbacterium murale]MDQ0644379.1 DNA-binding HxlR family transcriptional regulator [Microbacterium murale]